MIYRRSFLLGAGALASAKLLAEALPQHSYDEPDEIYEALASQTGTRVDFAGGNINVVFADGAPGVDRRAVLRWVRDCARSICTYFGKYPTQSYGLLVVADAGDGVGHATTYGYRGSATRIHVGIGADQGSFAKDWVLVHEMVHTALPDLPRRALWLQEGSATWIEPVARAQAGNLPAAEVWREAIVGMPKGVRPASAGGIDGTREWGRLYWGGAAFWLEAEIEIYLQSRGRFLLRDAMRAINRASGGNPIEWSPEEMMAVGDRATGTAALSRLYEKVASHGIDTPLPVLFERLGVVPVQSQSVRFNTRAELARLTRLITHP